MSRTDILAAVSAAVPSPSGPVGPDADVLLFVSRFTSVTKSARVEHCQVDDAYRPGLGWTSCLKRGHSPGRTPTRDRDRIGWSLDCACDVACPRCGAGIGWGCTTLDGGGTSGGGYPTSLHAARIKQSAWCQGLLNGTRSRCDLGDHDWKQTDAEYAACERCGRCEPLQTGNRPLFASGHWTRR